MRRSVLLALLLTTVPATGCGSSGSTPTPSAGTLYFSQEANPNGLFILNTATGAGSIVGMGLNGAATGAAIGLTEAPGGLLGSSPDDIVVISTTGTSATALPGSENGDGLAYHVPDGLLYVTINGIFKSVNTTTGVLVATLAAPPVDLEGLASDAATNSIFGIGESLNLHRYDVGTGTWSVVGPTGQPDLNDGGLAFDPQQRVLYAVADTRLYRLDPTTGAAVVVGPTGIPGISAGGLGFVP